jgi:hypothetical protein
MSESVADIFQTKEKLYDDQVLAEPSLFPHNIRKLNCSD